MGKLEASDGQPNRPSLMAMASGGSELLKLSGAFAGRSQSGRMSGLERGGGSAKTERAVSKALEWLAKHQNPDGSWGGQEGCVASVAPSLRLVASRSESLAAGGEDISPAATPVSSGWTTRSSTLTGSSSELSDSQPHRLQLPAFPLKSSTCVWPSAAWRC